MMLSGQMGTSHTQKAPPTFIDELAHGGVNITLYGKLHTGAGLDRYPGTTNAWPLTAILARRTRGLDRYPGTTNAWPFWGAPNDRRSPQRGGWAAHSGR
eukprot:gene9636-biopygen5807